MNQWIWVAPPGGPKLEGFVSFVYTVYVDNIG